MLLPSVEKFAARLPASQYQTPAASATACGSMLWPMAYNSGQVKLPPSSGVMAVVCVAVSEKEDPRNKVGMVWGSGAPLGSPPLGSSNDILSKFAAEIFSAFAYCLPAATNVLPISVRTAACCSMRCGTSAEKMNPNIACSSSPEGVEAKTGDPC